MVNYYISEGGELRHLSAPQNRCWISLISPSEEELDQISAKYQLDMDVLKAALDLDERSRVEIDDNFSMVLVNVPNVAEEGRELYDTIPLSIIVTGDVVITVLSKLSPVIEEFSSGRVKDFKTFMRSRFILQILYNTAQLYLKYLHNVDRKSDMLEEQLLRSQHNKELTELLKLQKSLVYFTTALRSNETVLEKISRLDLIRKYEDDQELLEDVIVENKQAIEMANIYQGISTNMMDAFASIISNNLNIVMKIQATITIVLSIPNMIYSAYGMNVDIPAAHSPNMFSLIIWVSLALSGVTTLILKKFKMFE
ncbi:MAG: magnesium transporter CorA family protein [Eubacteriaceae bacterium]|nr:magnesium transporter CorA family protein [Eubacteriaceae bacterium]